jgi:hypothetical protein
MIMEEQKHEDTLLFQQGTPMLFQIKWPGMKSIRIVEVTRRANNAVERSKRFFITNLDEDRVIYSTKPLLEEVASLSCG